MADSAAKKARMSAAKSVKVSNAPGASEPVPGALKASDDSEKRRVGRPQGYAKTGGRKKGIPNKISRDVKEIILKRGKPLELLCDVARGVKIRVGPQAGPGKPEYQYPTMQERLGAAKVLLGKIVPDLRNQELTGPGGSPIVETPANPLEVARRVAFLLDQGVRAKAGTLSDTGTDDG